MRIEDIDRARERLDMEIERCWSEITTLVAEVDAYQRAKSVLSDLWINNVDQTCQQADLNCSRGE